MSRAVCGRWAAVAVWLLMAGVTHASGEGTPEFPADPSNWIHSGPITLSALKGKAAFLWFFEEGCPTCKKKWPELLATAAKFEGKPVVFIGVNSGTSAEEVAEYAKEVGCDWPIIIDGTREYEKRALDGEISLNNIFQARVIGADGRMQPGDWSKLDATIERALQGAKWKVEPAEVPENLKPAWLSIEFGNYPAAASLVKKGLTSKKSDIKAGAEKLKAAVQAEMEGELTAAKESLAKEQKWQAFRIYLMLGQNYKGFDLPSEAMESKKKLADDPAIKEELSAYKNLDKAKKIMASQRPNSHKTLVGMLKKLVKDQGGTTAGSEAKELLARLEKADAGGSK